MLLENVRAGEQLFAISQIFPRFSLSGRIFERHSRRVTVTDYGEVACAAEPGTPAVKAAI